MASLSTKRASTIVNGVITVVSKPELEAKLPIVLSTIIPNITHVPTFTVLFNFPLKTYPAFTAIIEINSICTTIDMLQMNALNKGLRKVKLEAPFNPVLSP